VIILTGEHDKKINTPSVPPTSACRATLRENHYL